MADAKHHQAVHVAAAAMVAFRLLYGCSYRFHLSGDNSRDRYIKGS